MNYFKKRYLSFVYAFNGLFAAIKSEAHMRIHLLTLLIVVLAGFYFGVTKTEWLWLLICCALVISAELFNTAIEALCNEITKEKKENIKFIKDVSAAAVLVLSVFSVVVAILIFWKYFFR